jgi:hypothetical protein
VARKFTFTTRAVLKAHLSRPLAASLYECLPLEKTIYVSKPATLTPLKLLFVTRIISLKTWPETNFMGTVFAMQHEATELLNSLRSKTGTSRWGGPFQICTTFPIPTPRRPVSFHFFLVSLIFQLQIHCDIDIPERVQANPQSCRPPGLSTCQKPLDRWSVQL